MCSDNPTIRPDPGALTRLQDEEIAAQVRRIFADHRWLALRIRYPGCCDLDLLKLVALQAEFIVLLEKPSIGQAVFYEDEFTR